MRHYGANMAHERTDSSMLIPSLYMKCGEEGCAKEFEDMGTVAEVRKAAVAAGWYISSGPYYRAVVRCPQHKPKRK